MKLDEIRAAAEAKYGSFDIELDNGYVIELRNALRLTKAERDVLVKTKEGEDQEEQITEALRILARNEEQANALVEAINGDLAVAATIFDEYNKKAQLGEA